MAAGRPGGTPTRQTLQAAIDLAPDFIEVDVHVTTDGVLVVRHDLNVSTFRWVDKMSYAQLKLADPVVMTIEEVDRFIAGRVPLLLDVKGEHTAAPLADWLATRSDPSKYAVCSGRLSDFQTLMAKAPNVARWPSFPDLDAGGRSGVKRVWAALMHRRRDGETVQMLRDVIRAARDTVRDGGAAISAIGGMPWRDGLPRELAEVAALTGASGISVHQWLVTPTLVDTAHELGLTVTAWTVNRSDGLAAMVRAGVDYVTTDNPGGMQAALPVAKHRYPPVTWTRVLSPLASPPRRPEPPDLEVA